MMVLEGYYIQSTDMKIIEKVISDMKAAIGRIGKKRYKILLEREITCAVDNIAIDAIKRPDIDLFTWCKAGLNERIAIASERKYTTDYNFAVLINVFFDFDNNRTYIKFNSKNNIYSKELKKINELIPYNVLDSTVSDNAKQAKNWETIMAKYKTIEPLTMHLFNNISDIDDIKLEDLAFEPKHIRAQRIARYQVTSSLLNQLGQEVQIPSHFLMPYFDIALNSLENTNNKDSMKELAEKLTHILPDITEDILQKKTDALADK